MGLSAPKNRTKLSHDPNNTAWSKSTTNFGHKILAAQGWKPGEFLGAKDASHKEHYSAANASHIRVMLREENLGLGAQLGKGNAETFGLSMFAGLLGRLNGKDEGQLQKQEEARRDVELRSYQALKYGFLNFVRGGLLVGDKMEEEEESAFGGASSRTGAAAVSDQTATATGLKRKGREEAADADVDQEKTLKRKKRKSDLKASPHNSSTETATATMTTAPEDSQPSDPTAPPKTPSDPDPPSDNPDLDAEAKLKAAAQARKTERRARKAARALAESTAENPKILRRQRKEERRKRKALVRHDGQNSKADAATISTAPSISGETATPAAPAAAPSAQALAGSRHAVRQRYIQQKRLASMDPRALKEIFMLQPTPSAS